MPKMLSDLLEKLEAKFPEDELVMDVMSAYDEEYQPEEEMEDDELGLDLELDASEEVPEMDFAALLGEDLEGEDDLEDDEELDMPPKKKGNNPY